MGPLVTELVLDHLAAFTLTTVSTYILLSKGTRGPCGDNKIRGVNLGGWLVLERWMTPSVFAQVNSYFIFGLKTMFF